MSVWSVIVAAGAGQRFGRAKQYENLAGQRVLDWSLNSARTVSDGIVLVVPPDRLDDAEPTADRVVTGGSTRSASVRRGLELVPREARVVLVHDGARPLADEALFAAVVEEIRSGADAVVPAVPVSDTIRHIETGTIDRSALVAVQTPQAFAAAVLRDADAGAGEATDDAALVEAGGGKVVVIEGRRDNLKITEPSDLLIAEALLAA